MSSKEAKLQDNLIEEEFEVKFQLFQNLTLLKDDETNIKLETNKSKPSLLKRKQLAREKESINKTST